MRRNKLQQKKVEKQQTKEEKEMFVGKESILWSFNC